MRPKYKFVGVGVIICLLLPFCMHCVHDGISMRAKRRKSEAAARDVKFIEERLQQVNNVFLCHHTNRVVYLNSPTETSMRLSGLSMADTQSVHAMNPSFDSWKISNMVNWRAGATPPYASTNSCVDLRRDNFSR